MENMQSAGGSDPPRRPGEGEPGQHNNPGEGQTRKAKARRRRNARREAEAAEALGMSAALLLVFSAYTSPATGQVIPPSQKSDGRKARDNRRSALHHERLRMLLFVLA
jgi:hypothetical protein